MDWVKIYTIVLLSLRALIVAYNLGSDSWTKSISTLERGFNIVLGTIGIVPLIGRVFNWW